MQAGDFVRACGHHHFAADIVRDRMSAAEFNHLPHPPDGKPGSPRAGSIVEATVQHAAVMTALMLSHGGLLFEKDKGRAGQPLQQTVRGSQPNDASAHHYDPPIHSAIIHNDAYTD
jgi:hypothetical protein